MLNKEPNSLTYWKIAGQVTVIRAGFYEWIACVPTGLLAAGLDENGSQDVVEHENVSQLLRERSRYSHRRDYYRTVTCLFASEPSRRSRPSHHDLLNASGEDSVIPPILSISALFLRLLPTFRRSFCYLRLELFSNNSSIVATICILFSSLNLLEHLKLFLVVERLHFFSLVKTWVNLLNFDLSYLILARFLRI